jgi:small subunit ribosomal protein S8
MDTIGNMLTSLLNAQRVGKPRVAVPYSKAAERLLALLKDRGRLADTRVQEGMPAKIVVTLKYENNQPGLSGVRRISKPGGHRYITKEELPYPTRGEGFYVVSTSRGIMDERRARKEGLGGELMCEIW